MYLILYFTWWRNVSETTQYCNIYILIIISKRPLLGGFGGPLVYVALVRSSAVAHVKRMWIPIGRHPTESGERGQVPFTVTGWMIRRRSRRRRRSESSGHPTAARQRTWSTAYTRGHSVTEPVVFTRHQYKIY